MSIFTVLLKNRNFISKIRISKVTDYAALIKCYIYLYPYYIIKNLCFTTMVALNIGIFHFKNGLNVGKDLDTFIAHFIEIPMFNVKYLAMYKVQMHGGAIRKLLYGFASVRKIIHSLRLVD